MYNIKEYNIRLGGVFMTRREERETAFSLLYEYTYYEGMSAEDFLKLREDFNEVEYSDFVKEEFSGAVTALGEIDLAISKHAVGWKVSRMSRVTKSILRLAFYEMIFTDTPAKVVINEAVELAKKYAEDKASGFVNGILNNYARFNGKIVDITPKRDEK